MVHSAASNVALESLPVMSASVVTRFAPSPTGFLHIGGARTALFNWLFARKNGGKFLLRIEDTDRARSTDEAVAAIHDALTWLALDWDGDAISQFGRRDRHVAVAEELLAAGKAYKCYATPEELTALREEQRAAGKPTRYDGRWRDRDASEAPEGQPPVIRFKAPQSGATTIPDLVQGDVTVENGQLDDMILLRSDGTPTYMLAVVVDDHDMNVTHIIRGDDHLTNAFRQYQVYEALGWDIPAFAHIPLIHGPDGAKLSKRHGALGAEQYRDMGFLPEALCNYLLRLGWGHGDEEIIPRDRALDLFDVTGIGKAAARFDMDKLAALNAHYLQEADPDRLMSEITPLLRERPDTTLTDQSLGWVKEGLSDLTERSKNLIELSDNAEFYVKSRPLDLNEKAAKILADSATTLSSLIPGLEALSPWTAEAIDAWARSTAEAQNLKLGKVFQPIRAALCGTTSSPSLIHVMEILGKEETLGRISDALFDG